MDDDDEDFEALFFTECEELLSDLQEHLDLLLSGNGDTETLNAAFRAVHSVKGGAAAFGFDDLISFAHMFETVMDMARSDNLELTEDVCQVLLRSGDVMESLIEKARDRDTSPSEAMQKVLSELKVIADPSAANEPAQEKQAAPKAEEKDSEEVVEEDAASTTKFFVSFVPDPSFFRAGHDALKLIQSAKALGLTKTEILGDVAPLSEFSLDDCTVSWNFEFESEQSEDEIEAFFNIYEAAAKWTIKTEAAEAELEAPEEVPVVDEKVANKPEPAPEQKTEKPAAAAKPIVKKAAPAKSAVSKSLRVELARVDRLVNLVGEIVITQAALAQRLGESDKAFELEVGHSVEAMSRQTRELQESVMAIRAQPVKSVFSRMPRVVRDLAEKLGKDVRLELSGEQTEVDTTVIEELAEPLTHMLRNSMDHGLESPEKRLEAGKSKQGVIKLAAEHRGERVIITLTDDGAGINREVVLRKAIENGLVSPEDTLAPEEIDQLIFHAGFSTAESVSSVSGRGVGMDVVKRKILELGGRCTLKSEPGVGTQFTIALPLTLAILEGMTIGVGEERYILPLANVVEALRLDALIVHELPDKSKVLSRRGEYLPLLSIRDVLKIPDSDQIQEDLAIIVDTETDGHIALLINELIGQRQVVLKSLEANYRRVDGVSGATILGDGKVALILDIPNLVALESQTLPPVEETLH